MLNNPPVPIMLAHNSCFPTVKMIQNGDDVPISQPHPNCFLNICSGGSADDQQLKTSPERHLTGTTVGQVVFDAQEHIFLRIFQPLANKGN